NDYDVDILLVYDENTPAKVVFDEVNKLIAEGKTVRTATTEKVSVKYKSLQKMATVKGSDGK
ncbi:MAG: hypothetical protein J6V50_02895, partial [Clostridia bacterium]|nr:hypothetical protein [Clostridia bacterium]